jgi:hypothetical protein
MRLSSVHIASLRAITLGAGHMARLTDHYMRILILSIGLKPDLPKEDSHEIPLRYIITFLRYHQCRLLSYSGALSTVGREQSARLSPAEFASFHKACNIPRNNPAASSGRLLISSEVTLSEHG